MPAIGVIARALAGYMYAFISLLYTQLGTPQEADRLKEKDGMIETLRQRVASLTNEMTAQAARLNAELDAQTSRLTGELNELKERFDRSKKAETELQNALHKSADEALEAYGAGVIAWLNSGVKSVFIDDVTRFTGHSKRRIQNAITAKKLQTPTRGEGRVLVDSLKKWLEETPPPDTKTEPALHIVNG
jgi:predicted nuclease with TOPRIM domain